jgi:hypothetical protein
MAFQLARDSLKLHISHRPKDSYYYDTLGWIGDILHVLEYTYNMAFILDSLIKDHYKDLEHPYPLEKWPDFFKSLSESGFALANFRMRDMIPMENQSSLRSLRIVRSIEVSFDGAGDAIRATAEIIDPLGRRSKKEHNRHSRVMNRLEEEEREEDLAHQDEMNRLDEEERRTMVAKARWDLVRDMAQHVDDPSQVLKAIAEQTLQGLMRGANALDTYEVKILEGPTDVSD